MKEIGISEFRATYSAIFEQVRKTHQPIRVTYLGKPLAKIVPLSRAAGVARALENEKERVAKKSRKSSPRKSKAYLGR